jgi:hydroxymethylbilane synthase
MSMVIATRGSKLALWQANFVASLLKAQGVEASLNVLTTTGDRVQDRFLHEIGGKGLFTKELEQALLAQKADLAVHSLKDMPARVPEPFTLPAVLPRHSPRDLFICGPKLAARWLQNKGFQKSQASYGPRSLPLSATEVRNLGPLRVATGSLRRSALLKKHAPDILSIGVRGNVDSRLRKLEDGEWDALILAEASLIRLAVQGIVARPLDPAWFIPCAGQGALAIEMHGDHPQSAVTAALNDAKTQAMVAIEREVLALLGGDCTMPFGCLAVLSDSIPKETPESAFEATKQVKVRAIILDRDGNAAEAVYHSPKREPFDYSRAACQKIATQVHQTLLASGGVSILKALGLSGRSK